jgi:hypothetical protein
VDVDVAVRTRQEREGEQPLLLRRFAAPAPQVWGTAHAAVLAGGRR